MTIVNQTNKTRQNGDGGTTVFNFSFPIQNKTELEVYIIDTTVIPEESVQKVLTTDYTVIISTTAEGGSVTMIVTPTSDEDIFIKRILPYTQNKDLGININFPEKGIEDELDKSRMIDIQVQEETERTLRLNQFTQSLANLELPEPVASRVIGFDSTALAMTLFSGSDLDTILTSIYGQQLVQSADAETARDFLELGVLDDVEFNDLISNDITANDITAIDVILQDLTINSEFGIARIVQTLASDAITFSNSHIVLKGEGDTTDTWTTFNGGTNKEIIIVDFSNLYPITVTHGVPLNLANNANGVFENGDRLILGCLGPGQWHELSRSTSNQFTKVLLETQVANNDATIDFTSKIDDQYTNYLVEFTNVKPATDDQQFQMLVSENAGGAWKVGASDYGISNFGYNTGGVNAYLDNAIAHLALSDDSTGQVLGNASNESYSGEITIYKPWGVANNKKINGKASYDTSGVTSDTQNQVIAGKYQGTVNAINGFRFLMSSGNIVSGIFKLYGLK